VGGPHLRTIGHHPRALIGGCTCEVSYLPSRSMASNISKVEGLGQCRRTLQKLLRRWLLRLLQGRMAHRAISCRVLIALRDVKLETSIGAAPMEDSVVRSLKAVKIGRPDLHHPYPQPGYCLSIIAARAAARAPAARGSACMHNELHTRMLIDGRRGSA